MQANDRPEFLKVMNGMAAMKSQKLTSEVLDLWWACMQSWTIEDFKAAAIENLKRTTFMPTPKDFEDLRKAGRMTAGEAFSKALQWARSGIWRHPAKTSEAIMIDRVVAALGGWSVVCNAETEKLHFLEKRFVDTYAEIEDVTDTRAALPAIAAPIAQLAARLKIAK